MGKHYWGKSNISGICSNSVSVSKQQNISLWPLTSKFSHIFPTNFDYSSQWAFSNQGLELIQYNVGANEVKLHLIQPTQGGVTLYNTPPLMHVLYYMLPRDPPRASRQGVLRWNLHFFPQTYYQIEKEIWGEFYVLGSVKVILHTKEKMWALIKFTSYSFLLYLYP